MAYFKLIVRADVEPSVEKFREDLDRIKQRLDSDPLKIKIAPDGAGTAGKSFQAQITKMLTEINNTAKTSIAPLQEIYQLVTEISKKDFHISFNADGSSAEALGKYVARVREYASELQRILTSLPQAVGTPEWKSGVGQSFNNQIVDLYKYFEQYETALSGFQKRLNSVGTFSGAEQIAKEAKVIWESLTPIIEKANELGVINIKPIEFPVKPDELKGAADGVNQYASAMTALKQVLGIEKQTVTENNAAYVEHATAVKNAAEIEQVKQTVSGTLTGALGNEANALEVVEEAARNEAVAQEQAAAVIQETGNAAEQSAAKTEQAAKKQESSYNAAKAAVMQYYKLLAEARNADRPGFEAGHHEELNRQLKEAEQNYLRLTNAESKATMSEKEQAQLLDLIAKKQNEAARGAEARANKEEQAARRAEQATEKANTRAEQAAKKAEERAERAAKKEVMSAQEIANALEQVQILQNRIDASIHSASRAPGAGTDKGVSESVGMLNGLKAELDTIRTGLQAGTVSTTEYGDAMENMRLRISSVIGTLQQQTKALSDSAAAAKEKVNAERAYAESMNKAERALQNWSRAENSRNAESRQAYETIKNNRDALAGLKREYDNGTKGASDLRAAADRLNKSIRDGEGPIRAAGDSAKTLGDRLREGAKKFSSWLSVSSAVMAVIRSIRQMVNASIELDGAMTQMQVVTRASKAEMDAFGASAAAAAQRIGSSISDFVSSATTFARLGYSTSESSALAEYTAMLQNVGDIDVGDAQNAITAIVKAFNIGVDDIESVMDKLVTVGNNFPISVSQIAEGMNNASSSLAAAGNSFEQSVALLTAANTTVQNAAKSSTGLRTIAARIRNTKTELDELGESMEDAKYEELVQGLTNAGVSLKTVNGEFRSTYDIISDIAKVWDQMSSMEQAGLATALSGTRQQAIFFSLIEQFKEASGAMDAMRSSAGELDRAYATFMDSIQAHVNQFRAAFQSLAQNGVTRDFVNEIIDLGTNVIGVLEKIIGLINDLGGLRAVLAGVATLLTGLYSTKIVGGITKIGSAFAALKAGAGGASAAVSALGLSFSGAGLAITAIVAALGVAYVAIKKHQQAVKEAREEAIEAGAEASKENDELYALAAEYDALTEIVEKNEDQRRRLLEIEQTLFDKYGIEVGWLDDIKEGYMSTADAILAAANARMQYNMADLHSATMAEAGKLVDVGKHSKDTAAALVGMNPDTTDRNRVAANLLSTYGSSLRSVSYDNNALSLSFSGQEFNDKTAEGLIARYRELIKIREILSKNHTALESDFYRQVDDMYQQIKDAAESYLKALDTENKALAQTAVTAALVGKKIPATEADLVDFKAAIIETAMNAGEFSGDIESYSNALEQVLANDPRFAKFYESAETAAQGVADFGTAVQEATEKATNSIDAISSYKDALDALATAYGDFLEEDSNGLSYDSIEAIGQKFSDVEGIDNYIKRLLEVRTDAKAVADVMDELANAYALTKAQSELLAGADEQVVAAMLKEAGAAESDQAAIALVEIAKGKLAAASVNSADAMYDFIDGLEDETAYSETARSALINLAAEMVTAENTGMNFDQQIDALIRLAEHAGVAAGAIAAVRSSMGNTAQLESQIKNAQSADEVAALVSKYQNSQNAATSNADDVLKALIKDATSNVKMSFDWSGVASRNKSGGSSGGGGGGSSVEEYIADIDKYYEATKRLEEIQQRMNELESNVNTADTNEEKIFYTKALISAYDDQAEATQRLIDLRKESIQAGVEELRQLGFQVEYNEEANRFLVQNMGHLNELSAGSTEATNKLRQDTEGLINSLEELNKANQEGANSMRQMTQEMKQARKAVFDYLRAIVEESSGVVDTIQKVSDTLHKAADEFASSGFITVDTFQEIVSLGTEYMAYLQDENGMLVINEENINRVLAAKTQELAVNEALAYVERIRMALEAGSVEELNHLLYATMETTDATWGLVYANLALLGLDDDQYQAALNNINAIRSLADSAVSSIGRTVGELQRVETESLERMKRGVDDILKYVMDMLKQRIQEQIDALNDMKRAYADLIAMRKESIQTAKEETDYQASLAEKVREIAALQQRINALSLDNSRSATAERMKLEEELAKLQGDLADQQAEHSIEAQENALDSMQKAYEEQKDEEIKVLEDSISSYQKLYDMA